MVSSKFSRCWFVLLFVLQVQLIQTRIERWCRCTLLDETCCLDIRDSDEIPTLQNSDFKDCDCLCTSRTLFLSNPFLQTHPYFLAFPTMVSNPEVFNRTPELMMHYTDTASDYVAYPNLLEEEGNLRLLTELRKNISSETWSRLNHSENEGLLSLVLSPKSVEILVALKGASLIEDINNLSTTLDNNTRSLIPQVRLIENSEFIEYYVDNINNSTICEKLKSYDTGSSTIPGAILGILFVLVVGFILVCLAFQRGMSKDHSM